jgi:hypothetical protein
VGEKNNVSVITGIAKDDSVKKMLWMVMAPKSRGILVFSMTVCISKCGRFYGHFYATNSIGLEPNVSLLKYGTNAQCLQCWRLRGSIASWVLGRCTWATAWQGDEKFALGWREKKVETGKKKLRKKGTEKVKGKKEFRKNMKQKNELSKILGFVIHNLHWLYYY